MQLTKEKLDSLKGKTVSRVFYPAANVLRFEFNDGSHLELAAEPLLETSVGAIYGLGDGT